MAAVLTDVLAFPGRRCRLHLVRGALHDPDGVVWMEPPQRVPVPVEVVANHADLRLVAVRDIIELVLEGLAFSQVRSSGDTAYDTPRAFRTV